MADYQTKSKKGSFWWRDVIKLLTQFKGFARITARDGSTCLFWEDNWYNNPLSAQFPQAYSFARNKSITLQAAQASEQLTNIFSLPLSQQAFQQMQSIQQILNERGSQDQNKDEWHYFDTHSKFKAAKAYKKLLGQQVIDPAHRWLWKSYCQPKHKVFFWLLLKDRLSTRNLLRRKQMELQSFNCVFCLANLEETTQHLFWACPFAQHCWGSLHLHVLHLEDSFSNIAAIKDQLNNQFFMVIIILMCWTIWKVRNEMIFNNRQLSLSQARTMFFEEVKLVSQRVKESLKPAFDQWIQLL